MCLLAVAFVGSLQAAHAQSYSVSGQGSVSSSAAISKGGESPMLFEWSGESSLCIVDGQAVRASWAVGEKSGLMAWVCCPKRLDGKLRFSFAAANGQEILGFDFKLGFTGWRAVWMRYQDMERSSDATPLLLKITPSCSEGSLVVDRLTFSRKPIIERITPDAQIANNNGHLWHWLRLWEWEQIPQPAVIAPSAQQARDMAKLEERLTKIYSSSLPEEKKIAQMAAKTDERFTQLMKRHLVSNDERTKSDASILETMDVLSRYALLYTAAGDALYKERFFAVLDYLLWEGYAWGSGMGTNHHYGYSSRQLAPAMWLMRKEISSSPRATEYWAMYDYWSGLKECFAPIESVREEMLDTWNTIIMHRLTAAMCRPDENSRFTAVKAVTDWVGSSFRFTPGTYGGIKADGTMFHHGGHYPAYADGALASLARYLRVVEGTGFAPSMEQCAVLKKALLALNTFTNASDWGIGISGRHPEATSASEKSLQAFDALSRVMGGDAELKAASAQIRGKQPKPDGFSTFNYAALGIWHYRGWMLSLKTFNTDVWGSEIYATANRYGRYQSYGSAQLIGPGCADVASAVNSGFREEGWDWNSMPGATSIHLPYELLNSPNKGTLMARNEVRYNGVSSLLGEYGAMASRIVEPDLKNFCAGAKATKSAFCFGTYTVFLGSGISNDSEYPTRTTLFQQSVPTAGTSGGKAPEVRGVTVKKGRKCCFDLYGNAFIMPSSQILEASARENTSPDNTGKKMGAGRFYIAALEHGKSPKNASYEYMLLIQPTAKELSSAMKQQPYTVLMCTEDAHAVRDNATGVESYVVYDGIQKSGFTVDSAPQGTIIITKPQAGGLVLSVCSPDLGIEDKAYSTPDPGKTIEKTLVLKGKWRIATDAPQAECKPSNNNTILTIKCSLGIPVELSLQRIQ